MVNLTFLELADNEIVNLEPLNKTNWPNLMHLDISENPLY